MSKSKYYFMKDTKHSNKLIKTKKVRIFPTEDQIIYFNKCFGIYRKVYNFCITNFIEKELSFDKNDVKKYLNSLAKDNKKYSYFNEVNSMVRQECLEIFKLSLDKYKNLQEKRAIKQMIPNLDYGKPNRKTKKDDNQIFRYNNKGNPVKPKGKKHFLLTTCKSYGERLYIKCNESLLFLNNKNIRFIGVSIKRDFLDHYYACIDYEIMNKKPYNLHKYNKIGIDMGIKNPYVCTYKKDKEYISEFYDIPKNLKTLHKRLAYLNKKISKKVLYSKNYYKLNQKRLKLYNKIINIRKEFRNQLVNYLCKTFKIIIYEDYDAYYRNDELKGKGYHHKLNDISRYDFLEHLWFKSKEYNNTLIKIPNGTPTTQTCYKCGNQLKGNQKLTLDDRIYHCHKCGNEIDRDINASINILNYSY